MVASRGSPKAEPLLCMLVLRQTTRLGAATENQIHCEVSERSPNATDVQDALDYLQSLSETSCCQPNCGGSYCATMHTTGTAAVGICAACAVEEYLGSLRVLSLCVACSETAVLLELIKSTCTGVVAKEDRVGGWLTFRLPGDYGVGGVFDLIISNSDDSRRRTNRKSIAVLEQYQFSVINTHGNSKSPGEIVIL